MIMGEEPRPIGVTLLALLHIVGGLIGGLMVLLAFLTRNISDFSASILGIPMWLAVIPLIVAMTLGFIAGFGLWSGRAWGWWMAVIYYTYSIMRNAGTVLLALMLTQGQESATIDVHRFVYKHGGRVLIDTLIMLYLFRRSILDFFDLYALPRIKTVAKVSGSIGAALTAMTLLASSLW